MSPPGPPARAPLPIDEHLAAVCEAFGAGRNVVVVAPPGAGKTTRVPLAVLESGALPPGQIVVLEPRRIAARMSAARVASELGEEVGRRVGFATRFERRVSEATVIRFVTEGLLTRQLSSSPALEGVIAVLLDEFHERHLQSDLCLAMLRRLQGMARPDLRICVMSATIDASPIARYLDAVVVESAGRAHPVEIEHLPRPDERALELQVQSAILRLKDDGALGDTLVFLPGARAIRRAAAACEKLAARHGLALRPLFGSQSAKEQDEAIARADRPKVILATNVAETSITIDGVTAVVDSGLAQIAHQPPWAVLPQLSERPISKASARQRAGRAGRTAPGRCLRLFTELDFARRSDFEQPEIARVDLADALLELVGAGIEDLSSVPWFEPPPAASMEAAEVLLIRLGALERRPGRATITETGRRLLRFPLHPRLARVVVECERRGSAREGALVAALLSERSFRAAPAAARVTARSDVLSLLDDIEATTGPRGRRAPTGGGLDAARLASVRRAADQLERISRSGGEGQRYAGHDDPESAVSIALLIGFSDRLGRLRMPERSTGRSAREIVFASGTTASLSEDSVVTDADLVVAVDAEERAQGRDRRPVVRLASAVEADWILEHCTDLVVETREVQINPTSGRAERVDRLMIGGLVLEQVVAAAEPGEALAAALVASARARGIEAFIGREVISRLEQRAALLRPLDARIELPRADEPALWHLIEQACSTARTLGDLDGIDWTERALSIWSPEARRALRELAPEHVVLPGGRRVRVEYPEGSPPFIASRLSDFFGMRDAPRIAGGRVALVVHLLAPNGRAVQVTTDLAGFWDKHYPAIARELRRRYPKHPWPDDPRTARPPAPPRRR